MKVSSFVVGFAGLVAASPAPSLCDKYTTALLKKDTAANQQLLLTLVVNTAVIGNYTQPNGMAIDGLSNVRHLLICTRSYLVGIAVPGILAPGYYNGEAVNLLPYFNGALASTNQGGKCGVSVNFLDGGGAAALMQNLPAFSDTSNQ